MTSTAKERASKHAQRSRTCVGCGKVVRGNGGYTNHVRACRAWAEHYKDQPKVLAHRGVVYKPPVAAEDVL